MERPKKMSFLASFASALGKASSIRALAFMQNPFNGQPKIDKLPRPTQAVKIEARHRHRPAKGKRTIGYDKDQIRAETAALEFAGFTPQAQFNHVVNALTQHERSIWAQHGYPGLQAKDYKPIVRLFPKSERVQQRLAHIAAI